MNDKHEDREALKDSTSREDKMRRREDLRCSFCPPNRGENASNKAKHGHNKQSKRNRNRRP